MDLFCNILEEEYHRSTGHYPPLVLLFNIGFSYPSIRGPLFANSPSLNVYSVYSRHFVLAWLICRLSLHDSFSNILIMSGIFWLLHAQMLSIAVCYGRLVLTYLYLPLLWPSLE